jgi:hypothetical protein
VIRIHILIIAILFISISTASAFPFFGSEWDWSSVNKQKIIQMNSKRKDLALTKNEKDLLVYKCRKAPPETDMFVVFDFDEERFSCITKFRDTNRISDMYISLKQVAIEQFGSPVYEANNNIGFIVDDTAFSVSFDEDGTYYSCFKHGYRQLTLMDFILDYGDLKGSRVAVSGIGTYFLDALFLGKAVQDGSSIAVDFSGLLRDQRKAIMTRCEEGCNLTVYGVANDVYLKRGIVADTIQFTPILQSENETQGDLTDHKNKRTASYAKDVFSIHGFYIGMPLTEACGILNDKFKHIFGNFDVTMIDTDYEALTKRTSVEPIIVDTSLHKGFDGYLVKYYYLKFQKCFVYENKIFAGAGSKFMGDKNGNLIEMYLSGGAVDRIFNVADMNAEDFAEGFVEAYNLPEMEYASGWLDYLEYTSPDGFKIEIGGYKSIRMKEVPKEKERNFN